MPSTACPEIIIAYPILHPAKLKRLVNLIGLYPELEFRAIASTPEHLDALSTVATEAGVEIGVYVDLDTGMHRTGVQPGVEAGDFYASIAAAPGLKALGVHVFDGHTLYKPDVEERTALVDRSIDYIHDVWETGREAGCRGD